MSENVKNKVTKDEYMALEGVCTWNVCDDKTIAKIKTDVLKSYGVKDTNLDNYATLMKWLEDGYRLKAKNIDGYIVPHIYVVKGRAMASVQRLIHKDDVELIPQRKKDVTKDVKESKKLTKKELARFNELKAIGINDADIMKIIDSERNK